MLKQNNEQSNDTLSNQTRLSNIQKNFSNYIDNFKKIESSFDFKIPSYLIDEIIECNEDDDFDNLNYMINCAVVNGSLSKENSKILKKTYCLI